MPQSSSTGNFNGLPQIDFYQLRIWLKQISPMIWRRVVISGDITIEDLHYILQIIMGWSDTYLNAFTIHGKTYGVAHTGGISFSDNPAQVTFRQLGLRKNEKFSYEYNFTSQWEHEIRVEKIVPCINALPAFCVAGSRAAPPEDCGGPLAYMELLDHYHPVAIEYELFEILERIRISDIENDEKAEILEKFKTLSAWYYVDRFDRTKINQRLKLYFARDDNGYFNDEEAWT